VVIAHEKRNGSDVKTRVKIIERTLTNLKKKGKFFLIHAMEA
jgi:hypothetical protein